MLYLCSRVCCVIASVQRKSLMRTKERNVSLKLFQRVFAPAAVRETEILAARVDFCKEFLNYKFTHLKVQYLDKLISMYIIELNETSAIELALHLAVMFVINNQRIE